MNMHAFVHAGGDGQAAPGFYGQQVARFHVQVAQVVGIDQDIRPGFDGFSTREWRVMVPVCQCRPVMKTKGYFSSGSLDIVGRDETSLAVSVGKTPSLKMNPGRLP